MYEAYTDKIINRMSLSNDFKVIDFDLLVNGTGCLLVKHRSKYFEKFFTYDEMKQPPEYWIDLLPKIIHNYFYGYGIRKGLRTL